MKTHYLTRSLAVLSLSAFLAACGDSPGGGGFAGISATKVPTIEDVKAWRLQTVDKQTYNVTSFEVSDLSCTEVNDEEMKTVKKGYIALNMEHHLKAVVKCSYTINAFLDTRHKGYTSAQDIKLRDHLVKNETFELVSNAEGTKTRWSGKNRLPQSQP